MSRKTFGRFFRAPYVQSKARQRRAPTNKPRIVIPIAEETLETLSAAMVSLISWRET